MRFSDVIAPSIPFLRIAALLLAALLGVTCGFFFSAKTIASGVERATVSTAAHGVSEFASTLGHLSVLGTLIAHDPTANSITIEVVGPEHTALYRFALLPNTFILSGTIAEPLSPGIPVAVTAFRRPGPLTASAIEYPPSL